MVGVPETLANGPISSTFAEPVEAASLSSPATKLLNFAHIEPDTFSILGLEIHDDPPSLVVSLRRANSSSTPKNRC
jgi:hypothetical protein